MWRIFSFITVVVMRSEKTFQKETEAFKNLTLKEKWKKIEKWVSELAEHYDYFKDLKIYIDGHKSELDEEFFDAVFQIVINLAREIEKL